MSHPTLEDIVAGTAAAHVARCSSCRQLALLAGVTVAPAEDDDLDRLSVVDDAVYTEWTPLPDAQGGMGQIFRARDRRLGRFVAIKQLKPGLPDAERAMLVARFEREARLTARLQHPAIVGVHEAGRFASGEPFYAMPLFRGAPLGAEIDKRKTVAERLGLLANLTTVAEAIAYAHEQGIVHRDIKPDNILVGQFGETIVIDWGLAKDVSEQGGEPDAGAYRAAPADGLTQFGVGTANYMPPEQARGDEVGPAFDVYALGATLYHLLSGAPPYAGKESSDIRRALVERVAPRPLAEIAPEVPAELADIVAAAMALDPAKRLPSARELAGELRRFQTGQLLASRRYTLGELVRHWARKHRTALRILGGAAVVVLGLAIWAVARIRRERDRAEEQQAAAERELRRAQGVVASRSAADPTKRLDAVALGVKAVAPDLASPTPEAVQGLVDALTVGPALVPLRHEGVIKWFTTAGDRVLGVDDARALQIWDGTTGERVASYPSALPQPERPRVSPDGKRAVVCGFDSIGEVFELATGAHREFEAPADFAGCAWLPDGTLITAADSVVLRDPATLSVTRTFPLASRASSIALDGKGGVAVTTVDGALWLWRGGEPQVIATGLRLGQVSAFDRAGKRLFSSGDDQVVRVFDLAAPGAPPAEVYRDERSHLANLIAADDGDELGIAMWDLDGARRSRVLPRGVDLDGQVEAWLPGARWAVIDRSGPMAIVDVGNGGTVLPLDAQHIETTSVVRVGEHLATASRDGAAYLWDVGSGDATGMLLGHTAEIVAIAVRGDRILTASQDGTARIWSAADGHELAVLRGDREITRAVWRDDHTVITGDLGGTVRFFDAATGAVTRTEAYAHPVSALEVSPDGQHWLVGTLDGVLMLDRATAFVTPEGATAAGGVTAAAYLGQHVVSAHADGSTRLWSLGGTQLAVAPAPPPVDTPADTEGDIALVPQGDRVLAVRPDGVTRVLAAADLTLVATLDGRRVAPDLRARGDGTLLDGERALTGHRGAITAAARDGALIASASTDGTVRLWPGGLVIAPHDLGTPTALAFAGDKLVIGYASGAVRLVPTTPAGALARACGVLRRFGRTSSVAPYCD